MNAHIDVGTVLRGTVCDLYSNLVTRPTGAAVRSAIEQQVSEQPRPAVTTIDFSQVNLLDFSCADEIVAKLLLRFTRDEDQSGYLTFRGIHDGHIDPIETVLERHALALVSWHEGEAELFGHVEDVERAHWDVVCDHGPVTADDVARTLRVDVVAAQVQLDLLVRRRLLMREEDRYAVPGTVRGTP
ncbi:MAG TPA: hypothetical protein VGE27_05200 [Gemmatimonas sp.]|uniref:hypothetical protein n=1 Tax=Gemmatimonas sp. TaxID=1962908 RepID=UPI002ED7A874